MIDIPYAVAGLGVGAIVGLTGVGGGSLMTPVLVLLFGVTPTTAVGTDLLFAGITKCAGATVHGVKGHVDWRLTAWLAAGSLPATFLALAALALFPSHHAATAVVSVALGVMLVLTALSLVFRARLLGWAGRAAADGLFARHRIVATVALGAFIGVGVTLSSVGAGALGVAALLVLYPSLAAVRIVGTDIAHAIPITLVAGAGHAFLGHLDVHMLVSLLAGSVPGILVASQLAARVPERLLRHGLAAMLLLAAGKLVLH